MKIDQIQIENFLGFQFAEIDLPRGATLVSGRNGSGKTAIIDAIRFALTDILPRDIRYKKDLRELISDGADKGRVTVTVNGARFTKEVGSGHFDGEPFVKSDHLPLVLDAHRFARLEGKERRMAIRRISGATLSQDKLTKALKQDFNISDVYYERIKPHLRSGFELAETAAKEQASVYKKQWENLTGERWGAKKADGWVPTRETRLNQQPLGLIQPCPSCDTRLVLKSGLQLEIAGDGNDSVTDDDWAEQAKKLHDQIIAWNNVANALSVDGIPKRLMADAVKPFNARMAAMAAKAKWPAIELREDCEMLYGGRLYQLCSESQKWRCDAAVSDAIAHVSGINVLLLDRFDVLDEVSRRETSAWLMQAATEYDTLIVAGTRCEPMEKAPPGFGIVWVEGQQVLQMERAA